MCRKGKIDQGACAVDLNRLRTDVSIMCLRNKLVPTLGNKHAQFVLNRIVFLEKSNRK